MREIKFRAWNNSKAVKSLLGWSFVKQTPLQQFNEKHLTLMQYTGLNDKNGVEIYEGDIVRASLLGDGKYHGQKDDVQFTGNGIVEIDPVNLMVNFKDCNRDNFYIYDSILHRETEVIGNVYENPELLQEFTNVRTNHKYARSNANG